MEKAISRQRAWQMRKRAAGQCVLCGKPRVNATHCETHRNDYNRRQNARNQLRALLPLPLDSSQGSA